MLDLSSGGKVEVVTMGGTGEFPWGTRKEEHRLNPQLVDGINKALDSAIEDPSVQVVILTGAGKYFCNGMDLKFVHSHPDQNDAFQASVEALYARLLTFPIPTIAGVNGHMVATGAMLGFACDYRVMGPRGLCFFSGVDIGLKYTVGMMALMVAKTPVQMHRDLIVFGKRFSFAELASHGAVDDLSSQDTHMLRHAIELAEKVCIKGSTPDYRRAMAGIKTGLYEHAVEALTHAHIDHRGRMGFEDSNHLIAGHDRPTKDQVLMVGHTSKL